MRRCGVSTRISFREDIASSSTKTAHSNNSLTRALSSQEEGSANRLPSGPFCVPPAAVLSLSSWKATAAYALFEFVVVVVAAVVAVVVPAVVVAVVAAVALVVVVAAVVVAVVVPVFFLALSEEF